ncbi:PREDICTED: growth arrest and DNA damage-inducible protein GADD45 beta isoform X2 [Colobus angolensis palliatus]|nr:PREDICTED: growth arrest and DNA damage-inducible protein GADD45 beta isoform X2 [Colobus angolensis palliatus]
MTPPRPRPRIQFYKSRCRRLPAQIAEASDYRWFLQLPGLFSPRTLQYFFPPFLEGFRCFPKVLDESSSSVGRFWALARILQFLPGDCRGAASTVDYNCNMTLEELVACDNAAQKMQTVTAAVEELLVAAQRQDRLTVGVYESAKLMNVDPDSVVLCLLAIDEEEEDDIALQIHFTLIQSFCCDNDINIMRVSGMQRLAQLLGEPAETQGTTEARDLHCLLVTNPHTDAWKSHGLVEVASYCEESRGNNQWVPYISLQER